ncbi:hypothetical protein [Celeribacter sp. PS-C1]|uniref:hypothetical protein n=1 Tax=Celeribacter sp. PS-C1 TaxID=2820813 RepID=UPI001CA5BC8B|nr:hypothetical protein [Celeribacter sp. PS-C1]MBW6419216.1 hypothetical protein [Celeribacter sp. PS-C1]
MKLGFAIASITAALAAPALAHEGHATLPGAEGHTEAHIVMVGVAAVVVWLIVNTVKARASKRKEE